MQPQYLLTIILAITTFTPVNIVAGRPTSTPGDSQDTTPTTRPQFNPFRRLAKPFRRLAKPFRRLGNSQADSHESLHGLVGHEPSNSPANDPFKILPFQSALEYARKLHSNHLPSLLNALDTAGKALHLQSNVHVSKALVLTSLMNTQYEALVEATTELAKLLQEPQTGAGSTGHELPDIWPAAEPQIDLKQKFVRAGELLGQGDVQNLVTKLKSLSDTIGRIKKTMGSMGKDSERAGEIIESMAKSASDMMDFQNRIVVVVEAAQREWSGQKGDVKV